MKDLTLEDLQKIKHWVRKNNKTGTCPMCGSKCIIETERKERKNENTIHNNKRCVSSPD